MGLWAGTVALPVGAEAVGIGAGLLATLTSPVAWVAGAASAVIALLLPWLASLLDSRLAAASPSERRAATIPLLLGAGAPLGILPLGGSLGYPEAASVLLAAGVGVGGLMSAWRAKAIAIAAGPRRPHPLRLALVAGLLVAALVPLWPAPQGDEPHYLLVAHSLWEDGDLDLADDYGDRAYLPFHPTPLSPHYKPGLAPGSRYSMHGVGYPLLLLPAYALGRLVSPAAPVLVSRWLQAVIFAVFCFCLYRLVETVAGARAARSATVATAFAAPLLVAPLHLFPETAAMAAACGACLLLVRRSDRAGEWLAAGVLLGALPWLGVKYIPLALTLAAVSPWCGQATRPRRAAAAALAGVGASLAAHGAFTWTLYRSLSPAAVYLGSDPTFGRQAGYGADWAAYLADWTGALRTLLGFFLDQKEGLLAIAPLYLLVAAGVPWLLRTRPRWVLLVVLALAAHLGPYALSQQAGGHSPPVRPLMPVLWCLAVPLGIALATPLKRLATVAASGLGVIGAGITAWLVLDPTLLPHDYGVQASWMIRSLSPHGSGWWRAFPLLISREPGWVVAILWLAGVAALALWFFRSAGSTPPTRSETRPSAVAWAGATFAVLLVVAAAGWRASLPLTDRHVGREVAPGIEIFAKEAVPPRVYIEANGVWVVPGRASDLVVVSAQPHQPMRAWLRTLVRSRVDLQIAGTRQRLSLEPGLEVPIEFNTGATARDGRWTTRARVAASDGGSPAQLEGGDDHRWLGVHVRFEAVPGSEPRVPRR